jgi:protein-L-isoaspartate(D-aspartate) O-methyltransferase
MSVWERSVDIPEAAPLVAELRRAGIADEHVLAAIARVPRPVFVPQTFAAHAWDNVALPIGHGQTISQPMVVAVMTEALELTDRMKVLEIGTGSGYQTSVLSPLCRRVFTIERHQELLRQAQQRFAYLRLHNVTSRFGDGTKGWTESAPFDRILITAAAPEMPENLLALLAPDGMLVAPVGRERHDQELLRVRRKPEGGFETEKLSIVRFVPLVPGLPRRGQGQFALPLS